MSRIRVKKAPSKNLKMPSGIPIKEVVLSEMGYFLAPLSTEKWLPSTYQKKKNASSKNIYTENLSK